MNSLARALLLATPIAALTGRSAQPAPTILGEGVISTTANEFGGAMTPDGREIYFSISVPVSYRYAIYRSELEHGRWSRPELAPFSGVGRDFDPVISSDGRRMLFISDRPVHPGEAKADYDVWMVERRGTGWSEPRNLGEPINTTRDGQPVDEVFACFGPDGSIYVAAEAGRGMAIFESKLVGDRYQPLVRLSDTINAGAFTGEPLVSPDGKLLLFAAYGRPDGYGGWDIYLSRRREDGTWGPGENLGPAVNTAQRDYSPRLMADGHTLIFASERYFGTGVSKAFDWKELTAGLSSIFNGDGNLFTIDLRSLHLKSLE